MVKRDFIVTLLMVVLSLLVLLIARLFFVTTYTITPADSNAYLAAGDYLLLVKTESPEYGDLVLYDVDGKLYVGRIMGKAGDQLVSVEDILYRNQEVVEQPFIDALRKDYLKHHRHDLPFTADFHLEVLVDEAGTQIPKQHYFILNDNRPNLSDSRQFGPVPVSNIKGIFKFRLFPLDKFGFLITE